MMASAPHDFILHVVVVGFHHKKGGLVEYAYPPLIEGNTVDSQDVPHEWRHLPSLALPDGAHNFTNDTVYFHLPSRDESNKTVYGVSCYRQMDARNLINRTADMTRSTVQKSVCVLSRLPLFGLIKAKLELITHAYFEERDFSHVDLLRDTYNNLCSSISESCLNDSSQVFHGLSVRDVVAVYKHKIVLMFKLFLLERRVLFFGAPVEKQTSTLLTMISLFPGLLEYGLEDATCPMRNRLSPTVEPLEGFPGSRGAGDDFMEVRFSSQDLPLEGDPALKELSVSIPQEPESPSIPRDDQDLKNWKKPKFKKNTENLILQLSQGTDSADSSDPSAGKSSPKDEIAGVHVAAARSLSSEESSMNGNLAASAKELQTARLPEKEGNESEEQGEVLVQKTDSPLADLPSIVQIEAVQGPTADVVPEAAANALDPSAGEQTEGGAGKAATGEARTSWDKSDSIEELDSPESINKIDMEDCFSWEEDAVHLAINHEVDPASSEDEARRTAPDSSAAAKEGGTPETSEVDGKKSSPGTPSSRTPRKKNFKNKLSAAFGNLHLKNKNSSADASASAQGARPRSASAIGLRQDEYGFPLAIFTKGGICHPYLSLQYHGLLDDPNVSSFIIGATNILFHQPRRRLDAVVEVEEGKVDVRDRELQKQVALSTADLRFADFLVKTVLEDRDNVFLDGTEWEGGDEWLRAQFRMYLQCLLATMKQTEEPKLQEDFGLQFVAAFRQTNNYRHWASTSHPAMAEVIPGHPYQGHVSIADVRVRLAQAMQSTERGRRLNAAMVSTSKYVVQTGKAVGGALTQARSAVSSWFSSWRGGDKQSAGSAATSPTSSAGSPPGSSENLVEKQTEEAQEKSASQT